MTEKERTVVIGVLVFVLVVLILLFFIQQTLTGRQISTGPPGPEVAPDSGGSDDVIPPTGSGGSGSGSDSGGGGGGGRGGSGVEAIPEESGSGSTSGGVSIRSTVVRGDVIDGFINSIEPEVLLTKECEKYLECRDFGECRYYNDAANFFEKNIKLEGTQERICFSKGLEEDNDCPLVARQVRKCSLGKEVFVELESVSEEKVISSVSKSPGIETEKDVAVFDAETVEKEVNVVFTKSSLGSPRLDIGISQAGIIFPESCYNLIRDINEEGLDCGGPCKACVKEPRKFNYALLAWFLFIIVIAVILFLNTKDLLRR